jgi:hypothetical protein
LELELELDDDLLLAGGDVDGVVDAPLYATVNPGRLIFAGELQADACEAEFGAGEDPFDEALG